MRGLLLDFGGVLDAELEGVGRTADPPLLDEVVELRRCGIRTAIVGNDPGGPGAARIRALAPGHVDAVVLSGDLGVAKPHPQIYRHAARVLGLDPSRCVFVDDLWANVRGAVAVGMVGVHHVDATATLEELRILFDPR